VQGLTEGDADLTNGEFAQAAREIADTTLGGAMLGTVAGLGSEVVGPLLINPLRRLAISQGKRTIQGNSDIAAATRKPLSDEAVEEVLQSGAIRPLSTTQATADRIEKLAIDRGNAYGRILDELEDLGVRGPEAKPLADKLYQRYLATYTSTSADKAVPNAFRKESRNLVDATLPGPRGVVEGPALPTLGLRQTEAIKQTLQDRAKLDRLNARPTEEAMKEIAATVREANEQAVTAAGAASAPGSPVASLAASFQPVKAQLARTLEARHFARPGASKAEQRSGVGLKDMALGASTGNPLAALALSTGSGFARNRLPSTISSGAHVLSSGLRDGLLDGTLTPALAQALVLAQEPTVTDISAALADLLLRRKDSR
jgi:hypothetical protein